MSSESNDQSEPTVLLDFTSDETREWRDGHEGYGASPFFDSNGQFQEGFVTDLDHRDKDFRGIRVETYVDYFTAQLGYVQEDRNLTVWHNSELKELATDVFNTVGRRRVFEIRRKLLQDLTEAETWGLQRYEQLRGQLAIDVTELVGVDTIAEILDVRLEYQFERFAEDEPFSSPKLIDVPSLPESSVVSLCGGFDIDQRSVAKTALPFIDEIHPATLVDWYLENKGRYPFEGIAEERWDNLTRYSIQLDIVEFVSALAVTVDPENKGSSELKQFERDLRQRLENHENTSKSVIKELTEFTQIESPELGLLKQILESSAKTSNSPLHPYPKGKPADSVAKAVRGAHPREGQESEPTVPDADNLPAIVQTRPGRDEAETYLFLISRTGKPNDIAPKGVDPVELGIDEALNQKTLEKETLVAYPAPDTQRTAVEQMAEEDIVLIFDGKGTYDTEYRIIEVVKAPDTIASIWPESRDEDTGTSKYPYLILMDSQSLRSIPQPALNSLLGYNLTAVPSRWKVAEERVGNLMNTYQSIENVLDSLDQL